MLWYRPNSGTLSTKKRAMHNGASDAIVIRVGPGHALALTAAGRPGSVVEAQQSCLICGCRLAPARIVVRPH